MCKGYSVCLNCAHKQLNEQEVTKTFKNKISCKTCAVGEYHERLPEEEKGALLLHFSKEISENKHHSQFHRDACEHWGPHVCPQLQAALAVPVLPCTGHRQRTWGVEGGLHRLVPPARTPDPAKAETVAKWPGLTPPPYPG